VDRNRSTLSNVACPRCTQSNAHNQFAVCPPPCGPTAEALNYLLFYGFTEEEEDAGGGEGA
jgi:hypothetical protein